MISLVRCCKSLKFSEARHLLVLAEVWLLRVCTNTCYTLQCSCALCQFHTLPHCSVHVPWCCISLPYSGLGLFVGLYWLQLVSAHQPLHALLSPDPSPFTVVCIMKPDSSLYLQGLDVLAAVGRLIPLSCTHGLP